MPLADSNVWMALALSKHKFHPATRGWLRRQSARDPALFCRMTQQTFLRLLTTKEILAPYGTPALSNTAAWSIYEGFRADARISWAHEPRGWEEHWKKLATGQQASPKLWMDAYLAAFAIAGRYELVTTDKAFKQFKGLEVVLLVKA
jgi:toxin-antitoxin system PIN domain toxin